MWGPLQKPSKEFIEICNKVSSELKAKLTRQQEATGTKKRIFEPRNMEAHSAAIEKGLFDAIKDVNETNRALKIMLGIQKASEAVTTVKDAKALFKSLNPRNKTILAMTATGYAIDPTGSTMANLMIFLQFYDICKDLLTAAALTLCAAKDYEIEDLQSFISYDISGITPPRRRGRAKLSETALKANTSLEKVYVPTGLLSQRVQKIIFNEEDRQSTGMVSKKIEYFPFPNSNAKRKKAILSDVNLLIEGTLINELGISGFDYEALYWYICISNLFYKTSKHGEAVEMTLEQIAAAGVCGDVTDRNKVRKVTKATREKIYKAVKLMSNAAFDAPNMDREFHERGITGVTISGRLLMSEFIMKDGTSIYDGVPDHLIAVRITILPLLFRYAESTKQLKCVPKDALRITDSKGKIVKMTPRRAHITQQLSIRIGMMYVSYKIPEPQRTTIVISNFLEDFCGIHYEGKKKYMEKTRDTEFIRTVLQSWKQSGKIKDFTEPTDKTRITLVETPEKKIKRKTAEESK